MKKIFYFLFALLFLSACKSDPCEDIICQNDGICNSGDCECPPAYTGEFCQTQKTPTAIRINKVEITRYPEMDTFWDVPWDEDSAPDLYLYVRHPLEFENAVTSETLNDYSGDIPVTFDLSFTMTDFDSDYLIALRDADGDQYDGMGQGIFRPYASGEGLPTTIEIVQPDWDVDFKLYVEYSF